MLARIVTDLHHLKRVHTMIPDGKLAVALQAKLSSISLANCRPMFSKAPDRASLDLAATGSEVDEGAHVDSFNLPDALHSLTLRRLLDCLAYFKLVKCTVTKEALGMVRVHLASIRGHDLPHILSHCCTLNQYDVNVNALAIVEEALQGMTPAGICDTVAAFDENGVTQEDAWVALAEHSMRNIDLFTSAQFMTVIRVLYKQKVRYEDFFEVAERHISSQPPSFLSLKELGEMIYIYKALNLPVVTLLAVKGEWTGATFDAGLASLAVAPAARGCPTAPKSHSRMRSPAAAGASTSAPALRPVSGGNTDHAVFSAFTESTLKAIQNAEAVQLFEIAQKCEANGVLSKELIDAIVTRLTVIQSLKRDDGKLVDVLLVLLDACHHPPLLADAAGPLSALMNHAAAELVKWQAHRMLMAARGMLRLFPSEKQPTKLYVMLVAQLQSDGDIVGSLHGRRLNEFVAVMADLKEYGGFDVLERNMPALAVSVSNTPKKYLPELAMYLSQVRAARASCLPNLYVTFTSQKYWEKYLNPRDSVILMESMVKSRVRNNTLILGIVKYTAAALPRHSSSDLAVILLKSALLGVKNIEFFTVTATFVLEKSRQCTVHDLSQILYALTFVLKGVIKVVQQIVPRLRVSAAQATSRDITLTLYSLVKLKVSRHRDVTGPLCDRAVVILADFKSEELASMCSSLRALRFSHEPLLSRVAVVLESHAAPLTSGDKSPGTGAVCSLITAEQYLSMTAALALLRPDLLSEPIRAGYITMALASVRSASPIHLHLIVTTLARIAPVARGGELQLHQVLARAEALAEELVRCGPCQTTVSAAIAFSGGGRDCQGPAADAEQEADEPKGPSTSPPGGKSVRRLKGGIQESSDAGAAGASVRVVEVIISLYDLGIRIAPTSPLVAVAAANLADILSNDVLREELKRRGLLPILSGVNVPVVSEKSEDAPHVVLDALPHRRPDPRYARGGDVVPLSDVIRLELRRSQQRERMSAAVARDADGAEFGGETGPLGSERRGVGVTRVNSAARSESDATAPLSTTYVRLAEGDWQHELAPTEAPRDPVEANPATNESERAEAAEPQPSPAPTRRSPAKGNSKAKPAHTSEKPVSSSRRRARSTIKERKVASTVSRAPVAAPSSTSPSVREFVL